MKQLFISVVLCISAFLPLYAMDTDSDDDYVRGLNWDQFLRNVWLASNRVIIKYKTKSEQVGRRREAGIVNDLALTDIAKLFFHDAPHYLNKALIDEDGARIDENGDLVDEDGYGPYDLLASKNIRSDPYILFVYLLPEIQKKVLGYLELTSEAAQNKFLGMTVSKAFTYLAAHKSKGKCWDIPFDLYYSLNNVKQVEFVADIIWEETIIPATENYKFPPLPHAVLQDPAYASIMAKKISVTKEVLWQHGSKLEKHIATVKELCKPQSFFTPRLSRMHVAPVGTDSPTILSRVTTLFRSNDCTS